MNEGGEWPFGELRRGHYGALYCDPPWGFKTWSGPEKKVASRGTVAPYQTMEMEDIAALPVADLAAPDCCLFMWVVWPTLPEALGIMKAWGFEYKTCAFSWIKADSRQIEMFDDDKIPYMGLGYWSRANSEVCLLGTRGHPKRINNDVRQAIVEPKRQHSRKPDCVPGRIERLVGGPYAELFARTRRPGWDAWGNQVEKFAAPVITEPEPELFDAAQ